MTSSHLSTMKLLLVLLLTSLSVLGDEGAFLFLTFRGEETPMSEQVYFMISDDGLDWRALNDAEPVLVSTVGEKGVRDPFILPSPDRSKFYLIATDLSIHLTKHNWDRSQIGGSQSIVIWESEDLVQWSEPRLIKVAPDNAGCAWAPEAIYDEKRGEYMVFWSSKTADDDFKKQRIWAAHTKDFRSFGEPFIYIEKPTAVIDTTIVREDGTYCRFTKDEKHKAITLESSSDLMSGWRETKGFSLERLTGYEGPSCFRLKPKGKEAKRKWCLLLDWYSKGRGYQAYVTSDLGGGKFTEAMKMSFPFHPVRHGSVMPITREEVKRLEGQLGQVEFETKPSQAKSNNPIISGYYADPDIIYSKKEK